MTEKDMRKVRAIIRSILALQSHTHDAMTILALVIFCGLYN